MSLKKLKTSPSVKPLSVNKEVKGMGELPPEVDVNFSQAELSMMTVKTQDTKDPASSTSGEISEDKIEPKRVIPYVTAHVLNHEIPSMLDLLSARKMEDLLSDTIVTQLYALTEGMQGPGANLIQTAIDAVDEEISSVEEKLAVLQSLQVTMNQVDSIFEKTVRNKRVVETLTQISEDMGSDPLAQDDDVVESDFIEILSRISSMSVEELQKMYTTGIFVQAIADCEFSLRAGVSASFMIEANKRSRTQGRGFSRPMAAVKRHITSDFRTLLDIGVGDDKMVSGVFKENAYRKTPLVTELSGIDTVAYYCALLSKEFLLSSGLGRLAGTPLGQSFGASDGGQVLSKTFGTSDLPRLVSEATVRRSLSDYGIVRSTGNINHSEGRAGHWVMLLDAELPSHWTGKSAKQVWLDTIKSDPLHNKVNLFDKVMEETVERFENAEQLLTQLLQRDTERSLLTPRGLFTRILKDFVSLITGITVDPNASVRGKSVSELALLNLSARESNAQDEHQMIQLKRRLHIFACRLAHLTREGTVAASPSGDADEKILRLTSRDGSTHFKNILEGLGQDKRDTATAVMRLGDSKRPPGTAYYRRSGKGLISAVSDDPGEEGLMPSIVKIFEDLQEEAQRLAQLDDESKTYLRPAGTTRFSGFDGGITIAFLLECFTILADIFTDVGIEIDMHVSVDLKKAKTNSSHMKSAQDMFMSSGGSRAHKVWYRGGGEHSILNKTRKFLTEFIAASDASDISNLFNEDGNSQVVSGLKEMSNLSYTGNVTPASLIDTLQTLAQEDDAPIKLFAISKSLVDNMRESTLDISQRAAALRGESKKDLPPDIIMLQQIKETKTGSEFIANLTNSQLKLATHRLETIKNVSEEGYLVNKIPSSLYTAMRMFWESKKDEFSHGIVLFVGLPASSINSELLVKGLTRGDASIKVSIDKKSEILSAIDYDPIVHSVPLKYSVRMEEITTVIEGENPPMTHNDLVLSINYDVIGEEDPVPAEDLLGMSNDPTQTREQLQIVLESFLLKEIYQKMADLGLTEELIQRHQVTRFDASTQQIMKSIVPHMGLSADVVDTFYKKTEEGLGLPDKQQRNKLLLPQKIVVTGSVGWSEPRINSEELMTMYHLSSTKPFFVNKIDDMVLTQTVFDGVFAFFVNMHGFSWDPLTTSTNQPLQSQGAKIFTPAEVAKSEHASRSPDRFAIDTLYISADLEPLT